MDAEDAEVLKYLEACFEAGAPTQVGHYARNRLIREGEGSLTGRLSRWAGLGPYYAMFPMSFAVDTVRRCCPAGGAVLDPFAGRGTSVFAAAAVGRNAVGVEVHSAGWIYGQTKLRPAPIAKVLHRLSELGNKSAGIAQTELNKLPVFFRWCFCPEVLRFLILARRELQWKVNSTDRTLMAFVLNYLHNSERRGLSNQMHQAKSMAPGYSVAWWRKRGLRPPKKDPVLFLGSRIAWRYKHGSPDFRNARIYHADSLVQLPRLAFKQERFDLLFTSPPYFSVANYHSDQWLRLWLLGGPAKPRKQWHISTGSFDNFARYQELLMKVFTRAAALMKPNARIYVRTDAREQTLLATHDALALAFPREKISLVDRPYQGSTQTALYGDKKKKPGEVDLLISKAK